VYLVAPAKNPPMPAYNVPAGHSRQGSGAGGPRRSYRNVRASAVAEGTPFPEGPQGRLWGGLLSSSARAGLLPGCLSARCRVDSIERESRLFELNFGTKFSSPRCEWGGAGVYGCVYPCVNVARFVVEPNESTIPMPLCVNE